MYAAIIAGGSGTRLWPRSRQDRPKQFQSLYSDRTLLQETVDRLEPIVRPEDFYVIANQSHESIVRGQLEWLHPRNYVGEPMGKDTAPAVGVIATIIGRRDPDAVILISPADHVILKDAEFRRICQAAEKMAAEGPNIVTIGIRPTHAETGFGYIQMSDNKREIDGVDVHEVISFKEKPDHRTAEDYVSSWQYVWNSGMFVWTARTILDLFRDHAPEIYKLLVRYEGAIDTPDEEKVFNEIYEAFPRISVDYAILERAANIHVIPASIGWSDLGSWSALYDMMDPDEEGNCVVGEHIGLDTHNCLVYAKDKLITTIGLDNMIVVDTGDVVLVAPKGRAQDIKQLIEEIKKRDTTHCL